MYLLIQILLPLRPLFYTGNVFWTEEGYRMSWKMMLRHKTGKIHFKIIDTSSGKTWRTEPAEKFTAFHAGWRAVVHHIS